MSMFEGWRQFFSPQSEEIIYPYGSAIVQPKAWIRYTQPNGWVYYYHPILRVITSEDIHDTEMVESILSCAAEHLACMEDDGSIVRLPNDWQMSMVLVNPDDEDPFAISMQSWNDMGSYTSSEENGFQRIQNKSHFWETVVEYPMHRPLPLAAETEFLGALSRGADESSLGVKSTFPYDGRQIKLLLRIYRDLKALRDAGEKVPALDWYIGRVMCEIEHHHETTFEISTPITHRAAYHQKTEDEYWIRVLDVLLSFLFFGTHKMYRGRLRATEPRGCPHLPYFRKLMTSLLVEWADLNLVAIVFLAAEIAFLTLSAIKDLHRVATLASSLAAMTSIVTSLHNVWLHRDKKDAEFEEAHRYLHNGPCSDSLTELNPFDLTMTASILALPLVLLLWSILGFAVAIGAFAIQGSFQVDRNPFLMVLISVLGIFPVAMFFAQLTLNLRMLKLEDDNIIGRVWGHLPWNLRRSQNKDELEFSQCSSECPPH